MITTWKQIIKIEPRLEELYVRAKSFKKGYNEKENFCANEVWNGYLKSEMCKLVGWDCNNDLLNSELVYDISYDKIYGALPDCKNCETCV